MQRPGQATEESSVRRGAYRIMRPFILPALGFLGLLSLAGYQLATGQETQDAYKLGRDAQQGKKIAPVPLNVERKNAQRVYLGSYLVNGQGGCNSCHTCPSFRGIDPHTVGGGGLGPPDAPGPVNAPNYLAGGTPFPGRGKPFQGTTLTSSNLTPDSSGRPGGMTFEDFQNAMVNGEVSSKPGHILLVMPWPVFRHLYQNDLRAIYEYLKAIPAAQPGSCTTDGQTGK